MPEQQEKETTQPFANVGARTERGGWIAEVITKLGYRGLMLARVADIVRYEDGSEAVIIDGAGFAARWDDKPPALVGSRVSNGDRISKTLQEGMGIDAYSEKPVPDLFDRSHVCRARNHGGEGDSHA